MLDVNSLSPTQIASTNQIFNTQNANNTSQANLLPVISTNQQSCTEQLQQQQTNQNSLMAAFSSLIPTFMNAQLNNAFLNVASNNNHSIPACLSPVSSASSTTNNNFTFFKTVPSSSVIKEENSKIFFC